MQPYSFVRKYLLMGLSPQPFNETIEKGYERLEMIERDIVSKFRAIAPDTGAYLNEVR